MKWSAVHERGAGGLVAKTGSQERQPRRQRQQRQQFTTPVTAVAAQCASSSCDVRTQLPTYRNSPRPHPMPSRSHACALVLALDPVSGRCGSGDPGNPAATCARVYYV